MKQNFSFLPSEAEMVAFRIKLECHNQWEIREARHLGKRVSLQPEIHRNPDTSMSNASSRSSNGSPVDPRSGQFRGESREEFLRQCRQENAASAQKESKAARQWRLALMENNKSHPCPKKSSKCLVFQLQ